MIHNVKDLADFKEACKQHHQLHSAERDSYASRCKQACADPGSIISLIIDSPQGYNLPNVQPVTKNSSNVERIPVDAVGAICHTTEQRMFYFYVPLWKKNPNLIITILFLQIVSALTFLRDKHPPVLWIQLDNAAKENKNKWVLAFLTWLVHCGWFFEIVVSFLPPGHTHVDVDQMFSTFAIWLLTHTVLFVTGLVRALHSAYSKEGTIPRGTFLTTVFNWKGFFAPHMKTLHGLHDAHVFLIRKQEDGVAIKFKKWHSTPEPWIGSTAYPNAWLYLLNTYPTGKPDIIPVSPLQTEAKLHEIIHVVNDMNINDRRKWTKFFKANFQVASRHCPLPDDLFQMDRVCFCEMLSLCILFFLHGCCSFSIR